MTETETVSETQHGHSKTSGSGERLVYVMPEEAFQAFASDGMSLLEVWTLLWRAKWIIVGITTIFSVLSVVYALTATEWYRAEVLLAPSEEKSSQGLSGALGGLASIAGVSVGGGDNEVALAILRSRSFAAEFIESQELLPVFFDDEFIADTANASGDSEGQLKDIRDGVTYFNNKIRTVTEDRDTGLVMLSVQWTDPELASKWANLLVQRLNDHMRQRALHEAETNLAYLQNELSKTNVVTLQQSIGRLMENELQKVMLARGNEEFSFRVIDRAQVPKVRSSPRRTLTVILATFIGGMFAVIFALVRHAVQRSGRASKAGV